MKQSSPPSTVDFPGNPLADFLAQSRRQLAAVVVLPPGYEVGHLVPVLGQPVEQIVLAVDPQRLGRQAQGYHLEVREAGDDTDPWHIAERIDQIF